MNPTYRRRVERSSGKGGIDEIYLIGELKGFFLYRDHQMKFYRTGSIPSWQDSELYYDYIRHYYREDLESFFPCRSRVSLNVGGER